MGTYFARNSGVTRIGTTHPGEDEAFLRKVQNLGVSKYWITLNNTVYAPQFSADNYVGSTGSQLQQTGLTDVWQFGGNFSKISVGIRLSSA